MKRVLLGVAAALSVACSSGDNDQAGTPTATPTGAPYGRLMHDGVLLINWGWQLPEPDVPAQFADVIVQGKVVSVGEPRWTTPDGSAPEGFTGENPFRVGYDIYDRATVEVSRVIAGDDVPETIHVTSWGGRRDGVSAYNIDIGPVFAPGQEVVLFLYKPGKDLFMPRENWSAIQEYQVFDDMAWHGDQPYRPLRELIAVIAAARAAPTDEREYQPGWRFPGTSNIDQAAVYADAIVRGEVMQVGGARWSTRDGKAPPGYDPQDWHSDDNQFIYGAVTVKVEVAIAGRPPHEITVSSYGGIVDGQPWPPPDDEVGRPYAPVFTEGEEVILFLVEPGTPLVKPNEHWMAILDFKVDGATAISERGDAPAAVDELIAGARKARRAAAPPVRQLSW